MLDVDLTRVKDDITSSECGYSFVKHLCNSLKSSYEELLVRACTVRSSGLARHGQ